MGKFFSFDKFITPDLIRWFFFLLLFISFISALGVMDDFMGYSFASKIGGVLAGLIYFVVSAIMSRVFCELLIVIFKINSNLQDGKRAANWQHDLHHEVVLGKSRDGMKDALLSFASDLHEVFRKHEMLVAAGRTEGVQLAVSRSLLDLLGQLEGAEGYLGNLHII